MMARIVIDNRISGESTGRYSDKLVEHMHALNPQHDIIVLTRKHRIDYIKNIAPNFTVIESNYTDFSFGEQLGFAKQLYKLKADLVHFAMVQQPLLYLKPKVTSMLDLTTLRFQDPLKNVVVFKFKQLIYFAVNWWAAKTSKHIISISNFVRDDIAKTFHVSKNKITTTHNAADAITKESKPIKNLEGLQFIMYVGRPQPHKNLKRLIDAFGILEQKNPELHLVLAGRKDPLFQDLEQYVKTLSYGKKVVFTDFIDDGQLRWLYENTAAYVFPSLSEGFGLPPLEAMTHGAPVVSSNASCLPEISGDAALYFDPLDTQDMAEKIQNVLSNTNLRQELIVKGSQKIKEYSWETTAKLTLEVYNKTLKS